MDKYERRMLIRRDTIRQDQQELRGRRHRDARYRLMELRVRNQEQLYVNSFVLAHTVGTGRHFILAPHSYPPEIMPFAKYMIWMKIRKIHVQLLDEWKKHTTIRTCKAIKEELMMNRWHPDRVEQMLESDTLEDLW